MTPVMTRRIFRAAIQLGVLTTILLLLIALLDNRYRVLPNSIHTHLPQHHPGLVITDIDVKSCSALNPFSSCDLDPAQWSRLEKDLNLGQVWFTQSYVFISRKKEEELKQGESVVVDVKVGRTNPAKLNSGSKKAHKEDSDPDAWEQRSSGIWIRRSSRRHDSDSKETVTAVDVLFGADAVEPRLGWEIRNQPLMLDNNGEIPEAKLTIRRGQVAKHEKVIPRVKKDGKFKIMQAADIHLSTGLGACRDPQPESLDGSGNCDADPRTLEFLERLLDEEKPDMVVFSGDQVNGETSKDAQSAIFKFAELVIKRKIPFACIFGNHDDEGSMSRTVQMDLLGTLPYSLSVPGPNTIEGVGNYVVEVLGPGQTTHSALSLYLLDTHAYSPNEDKYKGYDWLKADQIKWFQDESQRLKKEHKKFSHIHLDMAFIHIPLPEYREESDARVGSLREPPTAPAFNSGFRDALVQEGIKVVSCGHDHVNDYCALSHTKVSDTTHGNPKHPVEPHQPALWMCYGGGAGFGGYGGWGGYTRRVRFFELDTNEARIRTWKRLEFQSTEGGTLYSVSDRLDEQTIVDGGKVMGV